MRATRIHHTLLIVTGLFLSGCADTEWPKWISGEPTRDELNAYQGPIPMPALDTADKPYPNLADVPKRPEIPSTPEQAHELTAEMTRDNQYGQFLSEGFKTQGQPPVLRPPRFRPQPYVAPVKKEEAKSDKEDVTQ
jgi:hypothetical protein